MICCKRRRVLERVVAEFARTDTDRLLDRVDENLAVADAAGLRRVADCLDCLFGEIVGAHHFDLHLGQEVDDIFGAAVKLGVALLAAKAFGLGDGDPLEADLLQSFGWPADDVMDLGELAAARGMEMYLPLWLRLYGAAGTARLNVKVVVGG